MQDKLALLSSSSIMLHDFHPYKHSVEELYIYLIGGTLVQAFSCFCPVHIKEAEKEWERKYWISIGDVLYYSL